MVTIKEIANKSGFSQATVSRLLNGDESLSIAEDTRKAIIRSALSLGYDRSNIKTPIDRIGLLFWMSESEELQDLYFKQLRESLEKYAKLSNMDLIAIKKTTKLADLPSDINGFIGVGGFRSDEMHALKKKYKRGVILEINPEPELFDTVRPDTDRSVAVAIQSFLNKGYQSIGFIGGSHYHPDLQIEEEDSRERVFRQELIRRDLYQEHYIFTGGPFSVDNGYTLAKRLIDSCREDLPEAILVASDTLSVGVLQAFNEAAINIPNDIELLSINDNDIAKFVSPPLSTFRIDVNEMAKSAIDLLLEQLVHPRTITKTVLIGTELVIRKSFQP